MAQKNEWFEGELKTPDTEKKKSKWRRIQWMGNHR